MGWGRARRMWPAVTKGLQTKNFFKKQYKIRTRINSGHTTMSFYSLPLVLNDTRATEAVIGRIYDAAKLGLKGDSLALAAGMLPKAYRQLCELDPIADIAAQKGKADGEIELTKVLHTAALEGDAKIALEILKHQHGWVAKQAISIDVDQRISIIGALAEAERRAAPDVIDVEAKQVLS